jgi:hypothetical protein
MGALSDERTGLSFTIAVDPRRRSYFWVPVPWDSRPYFTASASRLPFSSLPTTRGVTVEVFYPSSRSQNQSYVTTDGQSASLSWYKAPIWGLRPDLYFCRTVAGFLM